MWKIFKYSLFDLGRSWWIYFYAAFFFLFTLGLLLLGGNVTKVIISLLQIVLVLVPLMSILFGVMYYYNSREFTELLLAQPIRRIDIFTGQYLGVSFSLTLCLWFGAGIPFIISGVMSTGQLYSILTLLGVGALLTVVFTSIAFLVGLKHENRIKGFGLAVFLWLLFAIIYDGVFLILLSGFSDYPLENFAIAACLLNPIDLSRVLILLQLDTSALMGYTGAVIQKFLGNTWGMTGALTALLVWIILPAIGLRELALRKDF
jgi:Cu-processing system permease protein